MKKQTFNPFEQLDAQQLRAGLDQMRDALDMVAKNQWSVSRIYGAHNALFGLNETPETCPECLTAKVKDLRQFMMDNREAIESIYEPVAAAPNLEKPAQGAPEVKGVLVTFETGETAMFDATGKNRQNYDTGTLTMGVGQTLKPGTYALNDGRTLTMAPGGKATLKPADDGDDLL